MIKYFRYPYYNSGGNMENRNLYYGLAPQNESSGLMIRDLRKKSQLSQEKIAYGICSVQKFSRIESGKDQPTELEFSGLMTRLGEPGLCYGDLYNFGSGKRLALRARIHEEAVLENWEKVSEYLCQYYRLFPEQSPEEKQLLNFYEAAHCYISNDDMDGIVFSELCRDILMKGRPGCCSPSDIDFIPTQAEFFLMNAASVGLSESQDPALRARAHELLMTLLLLNKKRSLPVLCRSTCIGVLLNLCIIETENNDLYPAQTHLDLLFRNFAYCGGSHLYYRALACKADLLERTGHPCEASELRHCIYSVLHINSKKSHHKVLVF